MRQFILRTELNCKALYAHLKQNWQSMANDNKPLAVTVATYKDKRHNQQNRLYWQYLNQIAEQAMIDGKRFDADCWHEFFKMQFLGVVDLPNGHKIGESTTKLNVTEFAEYVSKVEVYAVELGVIFEAMQC